eukprot:3395376-Lingulodinium_polyedra.AAC.1
MNEASFSVLLSPHALVRFRLIAICPPVALTPNTKQKLRTRDGGRMESGSLSFGHDMTASNSTR